MERWNKKTFKSNIFNVRSECFKPTPPNKRFHAFNRIIECDDIDFHQETDQTWALCSTIPRKALNIKAAT